MKWMLLLALAACGDNLAPAGAFELVGTSDLGARGMNSALAIYKDTVYVGSRIDNQPVLIVDVSDPTAPVVVGQIGAPDEGLPGMSSRELRVVPDLNLLVVLNLQCSPDLHGCVDTRSEQENLKFYDLADPHAPVLVGTYGFTAPPFKPRSPHEFFIDGHRALVSVPGVGAQLEIIDVETHTQLLAWDPDSATPATTSCTPSRRMPTGPSRTSRTRRVVSRSRISRNRRRQLSVSRYIFPAWARTRRYRRRGVRYWS